MRFDTTALTLALASLSTAFSDSSPWLLFSTASLKAVPRASHIQTYSQVLEHTKHALTTCPTERYLIVTQPGLHASDLEKTHLQALPNLFRAFERAPVDGKYSTSEVIGKMGTIGLSDFIKTACGGYHRDVRVEEITLASLPAHGRTRVLKGNDAILHSAMERTMEGDDFTVLLMSFPGEPSSHSSIDGDMGSELKKRSRHTLGRGNDDIDWQSKPLFEKYQFFTPGVFMSLITAIVLVFILSVGLRALSSLEVSYGAFEKEMGPMAQKKQQ